MIRGDHVVDVTEDPDPETVFALLADECSRTILVATTREPMTVHALADHCDASRSTVYRRVDRLESCGLLAETTEVDRAGHHRGRYEARLNRLVVDLSEEGFSVAVDADLADLFTDLWEGMG